MLKDILDNYANATAIDAIRAIPVSLDVDQIARIARVQVASPVEPIVLDNDAAVSNWWLVSVKGAEPVLVAIWPPATHAEVMALNHNAISIKPIPSPTLKVVPTNTAQQLLDLMLECGYLLHIDGDALVVDQKHWIDDELSDLITKHQLELINILNQRQAMVTLMQLTPKKNNKSVH